MSLHELKYAYYPVREAGPKSPFVGKRIIKRVFEIERISYEDFGAIEVGVSTTFFGDNIVVMTIQQAQDLLFHQNEFKSLPMLGRSGLVDKLIDMWKKLK